MLCSKWSTNTFFFKNRQTLFWPSTNTFREICRQTLFFCFISLDEHFFVLHKISTNTFSTTMGLRIFFNISTHIDEHLMYYITLVIFSTFQHKSTNTFFFTKIDKHFFLQKSMNTFFTTMGLRIFFNISTHIDEHLIYYIALVIFSPLFVYIQWYIMYCYPL